jgi:outer membrane protein OmpA-like peptidoglycan-associated protein
MRRHPPVGGPSVGSALALLLLVSACSGGDGTDGSGAGPAGGSSSSVTPALAEVDGFRRLNVLPTPLASQVVTDNTREEPRTARAEIVQAVRVGPVLRVVVAWSPPTSGEVAAPNLMRSSRSPVESEFEIGMQVYDPAEGTLAAPLRGADGKCLCSSNTQYTVDSDRQSLYWADLPAPKSDEVTILLGKDPLPISGVRTSEGPTLLKLPEDLVEWVVNRPSGTPGDGAAAPVVNDVRRSVQSFGGAEDNQIGGNADVALPADVLFAFDSATLTSTARSVLAQAAPKLAVAAKGQQVQVVGHTDDKGSDSYNKSLSLRRAQAVASALGPRLRAAGITLAAQGRGETEPVAPNVTSQGTPIAANQRRNRRVGFVFKRQRGGAAVGIDIPKPLPALPTARKTTPSPKVTGAVASVLSQDGQIRMDVTRAQRVGEDLWLRLDFTAVADEGAWGANSGILDQSVVGYNATLVDVRVVDVGARAISPPLAAGKDVCLCSEDLGSGDIYENPMSMWAVFPAPRSATTSVTLRVPGFGQVPGVPLS